MTLLHPFFDWIRLLNVLLSIWTIVAMSVVTWRLAPVMAWYELTAREFIVVTYVTFAYGGLESVATNVPYGLRIWLATFAFLGAGISFTVWAAHTPKRRIRRKK